MGRSTASCGTDAPSYLRHTAASLAKCHPRAKKTLEGKSSISEGRLSWRSEFMESRKHRKTASEVPIPSYMRGTVSSRAKQTGKHGGAGTPLKRSLRAELQQRPQMQPRMKSHSKLQKRAPSALSDTSFLGDSALPEAVAKGFSRCKMFIEPPRASPEPPITPPPMSVPEPVKCTPEPPPPSKSTNMAALVLTVLVRMNKKQTKIRDIFDIVVCLNRQLPKQKSDARVSSEITTLKRRIAPSVPRLQELVEYYSGMSYAALLRFVQHHTFLVVFPFMLLHLALQFPSILATILSVVRGRWGDALFTSDMYFLNAFHRWVIFFRPLFASF